MCPESHDLSVPLTDRFRGCLLGLAVGDALGGLFEAQSADHILSRFSSTQQLMDYVTEELWYTDDTQMAIGVAETLVDLGCIEQERLCESFVANYTPSRGYGRGARAILEVMEDGGDYQSVAENYFPGGSYGNGAAMRVAPIGLLFRNDLVKLQEQSRLSSLPTHLHPLGIEGARLIALAVAFASKMDHFDRELFFSKLLAHCELEEFRQKIDRAANLQTVGELSSLGNGIEALESVPTAIASFSLTPNSYADTIANLIFLGGDTDTMAAMAGAISGAFLGMNAIPKSLIHHLESSPKGRSYLIELADRLYATKSG